MALSNDQLIAALQAQRDAAITRLATLTLGPSFSIDGVSVSPEWKELSEFIKDLEARIEALQGPTLAFSVGD